MYVCPNDNLYVTFITSSNWSQNNIWKQQKHTYNVTATKFQRTSRQPLHVQCMYIFDNQGKQDRQFLRTDWYKLIAITWDSHRSSRVIFSSDQFYMTYRHMISSFNKSEYNVSNSTQIISGPERLLTATVKTWSAGKDTKFNLL